MTQFDRFERELPLALRDVAGPHSPDYLTDILGRTAHTRQRPAWASLERWLPMDLATPRAATARVPWRAIGALALIALLVVAAAALYAGSRHRVPAPFGPARNGLIPYDANGDIYVADPVTGVSRVVVGGPENDYAPTFSPDGTLIGFVREAPDGEDVYVVHADGSSVRRITTEPLQTFITATWLPDSGGLVVAHDVGGMQHVDVLDARGGTPRTIATGLDVDWVVFRPPFGGEMLVRGTMNGRLGLYLMQPDGTHGRLLVAGTAPTSLRFGDNQDLNFPAYSPDGSKIYFNRFMAKAATIQAWVMNADGTGQHPLIADSRASWEGEVLPSPDGKLVAMWRGSEYGGPNQVSTMRSDGTGTPVQTGPVLKGTARYIWAPDSSVLLMKPNDERDGGQLLLDPTGGPWTKAVWGATSEPDWQRTAN